MQLIERVELIGNYK